MAISVSDVVVSTAGGDAQRLGALDGQVRLIVNVASRCGFTRQYAGLQALQEAYGGQGFSVLAFPCNDFGAQEPGSVEEIQQFCSELKSLITFNESFISTLKFSNFREILLSTDNYLTIGPFHHKM